MARKNRVKTKNDAYYHVVSRIAHQALLMDDAVKRKMLDILYAAASTDVQFLIPPEWSKGAKCDLLRVGSIMVERDTCKIAAAMSGCVYPTVQEGAFAITNHIHTAVFEASKQKGTLYPLRMEKDGTHIMGYEWTSGDVTYVLDIRIAVNKRRQMAVSAMFHIKGDGLHAKLAP